jgi:hypothetical protein
MMLNVLECKKKNKREAFLCISCCHIGFKLGGNNMHILEVLVGIWVQW